MTSPNGRTEGVHCVSTAYVMDGVKRRSIGLVTATNGSLRWPRSIQSVQRQKKAFEGWPEINRELIKMVKHQF